MKYNCGIDLFCWLGTLVKSLPLSLVMLSFFAIRMLYGNGNRGRGGGANHYYFRTGNVLLSS